MVPDLGKFSRIVAFAANSRKVDKIYKIKNKNLFMLDVVFNEESAVLTREKAYVDQILEICKLENINLIYPSGDDELLVLAKYKEEFEKKGIFLPVNSFEVLKNLMDKFNIIKLALKEGIPCPETYLANDPILKEKEDGWFKTVKIIKPRFGSASRSIAFIKDADGYKDWILRYGKEADRFILQDFIPGDTMVYCRVYLRKNGELFYSSCAKCQRPEMMIHQGCGLILEYNPPPEFSRNITALFRNQGYVGYGHAQLKVDRNTGIAKLIEINTRISRGTWSEVALGVDSPKTVLALYKNEHLEGQKIKEASRIIFVWPFQDWAIFSAYTIFLILRKVRKLSGEDNSKNTKSFPGFKEMLRHYKHIYCNKDKKIIPDNYFRNFFLDPLVVCSYIIFFNYRIFKEFKK